MAYIAPKYPTAIPTETDLPDRTDFKNYNKAQDLNDIKKELRACLIELGITPKGAAANVCARIAAVEAAIVPAGLICMWHGLLANIPAGWVLCDGASGTPDLRDKFVVGAASAANPGATGGASTVNLAEANLPSHRHSIANQAAHQHTVPAMVELPAEYGGQENVRQLGTINSSAAGAHDHGANTGYIGSDTAHENKPPYYAVAFIMKT